MFPTKQSKVKLKEIRKNLEKQDSIFSEKKYLDGLFTTSEIIGLDKQTKELLVRIENIKQGCLDPVISVYGKSGSGKSTLVKYILNNIDDIACHSFVNLRKAKSAFGFANLILYEFGKAELKSADGIKKVFDEIKKSISEKLESSGKKFIFLVLDEYDVIFLDKRNDPSDFMYKLLSLEEELREKDQWLCIITISNNALSDYSLDEKIKSRMGSSEIFFPSYKNDEMTMILQDRAKNAFKKKIADEIIQYCAEMCSAGSGDTRRALDLLRVAGEISDGIKITKQNIDDASIIVQNDRLEQILANLPIRQRIVLGALCENLYLGNTDSSSTAQIFETFYDMDKIMPNSVNYRQMSNYLVDLENTGLLKSYKISHGRYGFWAQYTTVYPPEMIGPLISRDRWELVVSLYCNTNGIKQYQKLPKYKKERISLREFLDKRGL